jgi:hypothetical protein
MLGGKLSKVRSETKNWKITKELDAELEFAEETQRFISRVAREDGSQSTAAWRAVRLISSVQLSSW